MIPGSSPGGPTIFQRHRCSDKMTEKNDNKIIRFPTEKVRPSKEKSPLEQIIGLTGATMVISGAVGMKYTTIDNLREHREKSVSETQTFTTQPSEGPYARQVAELVGWPLFYVSSAIFIGAVISHYITGR